MKKLLFAVSAVLLAGSSIAQVKTTHYANGQKMSEGVLLNADATVLSKDFANLPKETQVEKMKNCVKDGKWTNWYMDGKVSSEQTYANGKSVGVWKSYYQDGQPADIIDFNAGKATYFHKNGKLQSEGKITQEMRQEGHWVLFYEDGTKNAEGNYVNGIKDGTWTWYDIKGKKTDEQVFKNGSVTAHNKF